MSVRIRYLLTDDVLQTKATFLADNVIVYGTIHTTQTPMLVEVLGFDDNKTLTSGTANTLHQAKKLLKTQLKTLGVKFTDEVRPRELSFSNPVVETSNFIVGE